jgi:hypothetical protein
MQPSPARKPARDLVNGSRDRLRLRERGIHGGALIGDEQLDERRRRKQIEPRTLRVFCFRRR